MKLRLGRGATIAAAAVAASLFFLLCMAFYGREDFLSPEKVLERGDALRFRIASVFVEPFGAGAYLGFGLLFTWSVIAYFRESVGAVLPRLVGMAACIPSFCAMTSLASGPHEFWSGSVGTWMGDVVYRGFGPVLGWAVVGTLFLVSFAMATEYGFYSHLTSLRGSLSFPLLPPEREEEGAAGTAVLEPGTPEPVEAWKSGSAEPLSFEPAPLDLPPLDAAPEEALPVDEVPSSDAVLVDREVHLADIRSRIGAGGFVTEAELALVKDVDDRAAMADAIDSLFGAPAAEGPPAAPLAPPPAVEEAVDAPAAPAALSDLPDLPPFLVTPAASHPLMQQQVESESPAFPPAAPVESHARVISEEEIAAAREQAAESAAAEEVEDEVVSLKSPFIFAGVEFLPPNEELADPDAPAPAPVVEAEAVEALPAVEAAAEAPAGEAAPPPPPPAPPPPPGGGGGGGAPPPPPPPSPPPPPPPPPGGGGGFGGAGATASPFSAQESSPSPPFPTPIQVVEDCSRIIHPLKAPPEGSGCPVPPHVRTIPRAPRATPAAGRSSARPACSAGGRSCSSSSWPSSPTTPPAPRGGSRGRWGSSSHGGPSASSG